MTSMTPLYDSMVCAPAGGVLPAVPRHPDIYQQLCCEHGEIFDWPVEPAEAQVHDAAHGVAGLGPVAGGDPGWFETRDEAGWLQSGDQAGWSAA